MCEFMKPKIYFTTLTFMTFSIAVFLLRQFCM